MYICVSVYVCMCYICIYIIYIYIKVVHLEESKLQIQSPQKRIGDITVFTSFSIILRKHKSNGVKGNVKSSSKTSPGGRLLRQQYTFHRHPTTVYMRKTIKIATWNVITMH